MSYAGGNPINLTDVDGRCNTTFNAVHNAILDDALDINRPLKEYLGNVRYFGGDGGAIDVATRSYLRSGSYGLPSDYARHYVPNPVTPMDGLTVRNFSDGSDALSPKEQLSRVLDYTPVIGAVKATFQTTLGIDLVTGKDVSRVENFLLSGLSLAPVGGAMSAVERASMSSGMTTARSGIKAMRTPAIDWTLAGTRTRGYTTVRGDIFIQPGLSRAQQRLTLRHEGVHSFLTPEGTGRFTTFRQNLSQSGYDQSAFLKSLEEIIAETYSTGSLRSGFKHAFGGQYKVRGGTVVTPWNAGFEFGGGLLGVGGLTYGANKIGNHFWRGVDD